MTNERLVGGLQEHDGFTRVAVSLETNHVLAEEFGQVLRFRAPRGNPVHFRPVELGGHDCPENGCLEDLAGLGRRGRRQNEVSTELADAVHTGNRGQEIGTAEAKGHGTCLGNRFPIGDRQRGNPLEGEAPVHPGGEMLVLEILGQRVDLVDVLAGSALPSFRIPDGHLVAGNINASSVVSLHLYGDNEVLDLHLDPAQPLAVLVVQGLARDEIPRLGENTCHHDIDVADLVTGQFRVGRDFHVLDLGGRILQARPELG